MSTVAKCRKGLHEMTPENTLPSKHGWRPCRECHRASARRSTARRTPERVEEVRERTQTWHKENREQVLKGKRDKYKEHREIIIALKSVPCMDCRQSFPTYVMDFDHRPGEKKAFNITSHLGNRSWETILFEISKCDIVCSNCHRIRTYGGSRPSWKGET